jgi:dTDP-4-amino-4,6-dideoxygalactose transaminase
MIPLFYPPAQDVELILAEMRDTLSRRWWGQGPKVDRFEREFGEKFGFPRCVFVNSGTAALHLAYALAGVGPGDEVIVPVLTCTATCHPILLLGAKPVFADVRRDTLTLDPLDVRKKISSRTKAIVAVHLGGIVADSEHLKEIARDHDIALIEDAAQALGAPGVGYGDFTCFSFQAIKHMSTGDGGMLVVRTEYGEKLAKRLRWFDIDREAKIARGWQAWDRRGITFDQERPGYKYQGNDIAASIGLAALKTVDATLGHRARLADLYRRLLSGVYGIRLLADEPSSHWLFQILVQWDRDGLAEYFAAEGIETNVAHVRNDLFTVFGGRRQPGLLGMDEVEPQYLCLPIHDHVSANDVGYICGKIRLWSMKDVVVAEKG